jgi:hypothetical protein
VLVGAPLAPADVLPPVPCPGVVALLEHPLSAPLTRTNAVDLSSELLIMK